MIKQIQIKLSKESAEELADIWEKITNGWTKEQKEALGVDGETREEFIQNCIEPKGALFG